MGASRRETPTSNLTESTEHAFQRSQLGLNMQKIGARAKTQMSGVGEVEQANECLPPYPTILKNSLTDFSRLSSLTD